MPDPTQINLAVLAVNQVAGMFVTVFGTFAICSRLVRWGTEQPPQPSAEAGS